MQSKLLKTLVVGFVLTASSALNSASASLMTVEFNNGDTLAGWSTDRSTPAGFEIVNNELVMTVAGNLNANNFYNTQGMALDLGMSTFLSIDMFVDQNWNTDGRFGGIWGVAYNGSNEISAYPIMEAQGNNGGQINIWDSNIGWAFQTNLFNVGEFNTFTFEVTGNGIEHFINEQLVYTDSASDVKYLGDVILNGYNTMSVEGGYQVRYDNLTYGTVDVPEPSTLAIFGLALAGLSARRFTKK